jgi:hypothetical protein
LGSLKFHILPFKLLSLLKIFDLLYLSYSL